MLEPAGTRFKSSGSAACGRRTRYGRKDFESLSQISHVAFRLISQSKAKKRQKQSNYLLQIGHIHHPQFVVGTHPGYRNIG
jgi:hypothetical protein